METKKNSLGQKIKRYRLINDIRQEDLAEKMGISRATLINYEKGHTAINLDVLNRLKNNYPDFELTKDENIKPQIIVNNVIDFKILLNVLIEKKFFIITFSLSLSFLVTLLSFMMKDNYNAQISLYPAKKDPTQVFGQFQSLAANFGVNTANNDRNFDISDVAKSRLIASKAVNKRWLTKDETYATLTSLWDMNKPPVFNFGKKNDIDSVIVIEKAIQRFIKHIEVSEDRMSGLIRISTNFQDPVICSEVANFIGIEVERYIQKENSAQSKKEKIFISERLSIVKEELKVAEIELKEFKERNRGYEESPELFMFFSQFLREVEVKKEVYLTLQQQLELARIEEVKKSPILHVLDYAVPPTEKSSPNRLFYLFGSFVFGLIFSSIRTIFKY